MEEILDLHFSQYMRPLSSYLLNRRSAAQCDLATLQARVDWFEPNQVPFDYQWAKVNILFPIARIC